MRAIVFDRFGTALELQERDMPRPAPKAHEVQVRLAYTGVNPVDYKIREGYLKDLFPHTFPIIPGWEGAGVVTEVGKDVKSVTVGDEVYGYFRLPEIGRGTYAEYISLPEEYVVLVPDSLSLKEAAGVPLAALTAWQSLFDVGRLKAGQTVMVLGGAGGVGGFAVQLAAWAKATVYSTASEENHPYVTSLGALKVFDYKKDNPEKSLKKTCPEGVDLVFDCVGGKALQDALTMVKKGGTIVSIVDKTIEQLVPKGIQGKYHFVTPNAQELAEIGKLFNDKKLKMAQIQEFSLSEAAKAQELLSTRHVRGKIVLRI